MLHTVFGESLPALFFSRLSDFRSCDLLITIGTSLKVQPFASLIDKVADDVPRLLINLEPVGEIDEFETNSSSLFGGSYREEGFDFNGSTRGGKEYARDVKWLGEADKGVRNLARLLGWEDELEDLFEMGRKDYEAKEHLRTASVSTPSTPAKKPTNPSKETEETPSKAKAQDEKGEEADKENVPSLEERIKKEEELEEIGIENAKQEAKKLAKEIGEIADKDIFQKGEDKNENDKGEEEEKEVERLAEQIQKLDV
jgi:hypothetical protein